MLEIRSLSKRYPNGTEALREVSLAMDEGVLGLLGPNGAGKTTLMTILATVTRPSSGTFLWRGQDAVREPLALRRELGFLPQDFGIYERLSAREFLRYLGRLKGIAGKPLERRVGELLELVNLHHAADRRLGGFSGGMRQRVGIAQALLGDPRLLIVDEPTVGLDPEERVRFRNLLSETAHGRLVALSTPEEMLRGAQGRVFEAVVSAERLAEAQRTVAVSNLARRAEGVRLRFVGDGNALEGARPVEPTLEDAYLLINLRTPEPAPPQALAS